MISFPQRIATFRPRVVQIALTTCVVILMTTSAMAQDALPLANPPEGTPPEDVEAVTRGPLHEAFAEMHVPDPEPGLSVDKAPPAPIEELPPEHKPDGEDVVWIPGYWAWDVDREDYLWISGVWRKVPPGRTWVPGYWSGAEARWQWVSGFWAASGAGEVEYLPAPPKSVESGPSSPAPGDNYSYVPGNWMHLDDDYHWRAGHWRPTRADWVWIPGRYIWTPRGCIYRPGYWDYVPHHRGALFAPICFHNPVYLQPGYHFTPHCVIDIGASFFVHLFARPGYCHYYFGDYYADHYRQHRILPWINLWTHHQHYDPLYAHYSHCSRHQTMLTRIRGWHGYFDKHHDHRPAHTFATQLRTHGHHGGDINRMSSLGGRYHDLVQRPDRRNGFVHIERGPRENLQAHLTHLRGFARQRAALESPHPNNGSGGPGDRAGRHERTAERLRLPKLDGQYARAMRPRPQFAENEEAAARGALLRARSSASARQSLGGTGGEPLGGRGSAPSRTVDRLRDGGLQDHFRRWDENRLEQLSRTQRERLGGPAAPLASSPANDIRRPSSTDNGRGSSDRGGDAVSEFLQQQRAQLGRQHENRLTQPRPDLDTRDQRVRSELGGFPWRSGDTPFRARSLPQTNLSTPPGKPRDTMAEVIQQQRARLGRQLENTVTRPRPSTDPRLPTARSNAEQASAAMRFLPGRSGGPAPSVTRAPQPSSQPSPARRDNMAKFFQQQQSRIERQAANQASRPRPPSPSARPTTKPSPRPPTRPQPALGKTLGRGPGPSNSGSSGRPSLPLARPGRGAGSNRGSSIAPARPSSPPAASSRPGRSFSAPSPRSSGGVGSGRSSGPSRGLGSGRSSSSGRGGGSGRGRGNEKGN